MRAGALFFHPSGQTSYLLYYWSEVLTIGHLPSVETRYFDYDSACVVRV